MAVVVRDRLQGGHDEKESIVEYLHLIIYHQ